MSVIPWLIAIPLTAFVMGGWRRYIPLIFKKRSRKLFNRMLCLASASRFMIWHEVLESRGATEDQGVADKRAGDIVRWMFNDPETYVDMKNPLWPHTGNEAMAWLEANPDWRELVLQTMKIEYIAKNEGNASDKDLSRLIMSPVFQEYGRNYPMKIDHQIYKKLMTLMLSRSPDTVKDVVKQKFSFPEAEGL